MTQTSTLRTQHSGLGVCPILPYLQQYTPTSAVTRRAYSTKLAIQRSMYATSRGNLKIILHMLLKTPLRNCSICGICSRLCKIRFRLIRGDYLLLKTGNFLVAEMSVILRHCHCRHKRQNERIGGNDEQVFTMGMDFMDSNQSDARNSTG